MWAAAAITTASKPYTNSRQGRIPQDYVDLSTDIHAAVQDHSLIVSLALPGLHYKERVHDDVAIHKSCFRQHMEQVQKTGVPPPPHIQYCTDSRQYDTLCISQPCDLFLDQTYTEQHAHLPQYQKLCSRARLLLGDDYGNRC
jgi:hypothetical protein